MSKQLKSSFMLLVTAIIWGVAFVAQSVGMDYMGPFTFNAVRFLMGSGAVWVFIWISHKGAAQRGMAKTATMDGEPKEATAVPGDHGENVEKTYGENVAKTHAGRRTVLVGGLCCGAALAFSTLIQQLGIMESTVGKAGFLTAMYIVIVPILRRLGGKKSSPIIWAGVALAVLGMYLLCVKGGMGGISRGDVFLTLGAVGFSFHILIIDYFSPRTDGTVMSAIQFLVAAAVSGIGMVLTETPTFSALWEGRVSLVYAGIMSCGVAYTFQILGQKNMNPVVASLILSLESVFSVLAGWVLLGQRMSARELLGCALMFAAVVLAQVPDTSSGRSS
ncbi:MAG: DMT family transporter [Lachnospiraceae bacterium]|jgi:drug/metabolite transporter (DMT)-like permease|nr:DMT family transporter [Lachnospiraceae bacterium]